MIMAERNWIMDDDIDTPRYIVRITRGDRMVGYLSGTLSTVLDLLGDAAYADAIGEDADDLTVWVLTELGPLPASVTSKAHPGVGFVEHRVSWRDPLTRGRQRAEDMPGETGYTKILDI